ncbi:MAG TPA: thioredoxin domain-containing protein, partial [Saprospiraceae bacterium]|nr:thioredoxin domain-containing protein [Saprospiraceae bacterium]
MTNHEYTNELIHESSPYLLQHAHNPVNWHAWKPETLAKAVAEDKPILVSIGYSTCHWCHVMERESFEDPSVAALMNELFINIKVDREERPDIDHIYMEAVQFITGAGGWPLNCFLLPDGRPFYGGTYFPPEERYGRASWRQVLVNIAKAYKDQKSAVTEQADRLTGAIAENEKRFISDSRLI